MEIEYIRRSASIYSRCSDYASCCSVIVLDIDIRATPRRGNSICGRQRDIAEKHLSSLPPAYAMQGHGLLHICCFMYTWLTSHHITWSGVNQYDRRRSLEA